MAKSLAIFCDGTWNDLRMAQRTNVSRLAKCVAPFSADCSNQQIVFYDEGVGVAPSISKPIDGAIGLLGGAAGRGLDGKIESAYRFLVSNYEAGDGIYVFGFSRGAYTARSLCGLIRKCGILRRDCFDLTPKALELYRNDLHPRSPEMVDFRAAHTHPLATGSEDYDRLGVKPPPASARTTKSKRSRAELYQYRPKQMYRVMYLGVWDTVGSLGLPERLGPISRWANRKYAFHDTDASSLLSSIRHAVAIDEDRRVFAATGFDNIDKLNREWGRHTGWDVETPTAATHVPYPYRPYQQRWFPGDHGAVGGGNAEPGLSSAALLWIAEGAQAAGLNLIYDAENELGRAQRLVNACADWRVDKHGARKKPNDKDMLGEVGGYRPRVGPRHFDEVSETTIERWRRMDSYRPANLTVMSGFDAAKHAPKPPPPGFSV